MPPKGLSFLGKPKVFLATRGGSMVVGELVDGGDGTLQSPDQSAMEFDRAINGSLSFQFTITRMKRRTRVKMLQLAGILDRPKCTYKTIRRDCAKRNRKYHGR